MNIDKIIRGLLSVPYLLLLWIVELEVVELDSPMTTPETDREAIRREAFKEAALLVQKHEMSAWVLVEEILALGEPDPKPEGVEVLNV